MPFKVSRKTATVVVHEPSLTPALLDIPGAFKLSDTLDHFICINHTVINSVKLRELGVEVFSPIAYQYDWPRVNGKFEPSQHQKEIAAFSTLFKRSYDLSEVGTRKTHSHIFAADFLQQVGEVRKVLVVSPLSTLNRVWSDALFFTLPKKSAVVLHGTAAKRKKLFAEDHDFYIINHDGLNIITERKYNSEEQLINATLLRDDIDLVIVDEGAEFRNWGTNKEALLRKLIKPSHWVHWLTGTPTPEAPTDAWSQARIVTPERVPPYWSKYRDITMRQLTQYKWEARPEATTIVHSTLQPAIRYERSQVIPINEPVYSERECKLTAEQNKHYKALKNEFMTMFETGQKVVAVNQGVLRSKLIQAACGVVYDQEGNVIVMDAKPRHDVTREIVRQCGQKTIVFVPFRHALAAIEAAISKEFTCEHVHGGVSRKKRDDIFLRFQQDKDPRVLVAHPKCMSHGLTLTEASTILWYAPPPSNNVYTQANGRITRDGQLYVPNIIHLSGTAAERTAYQRVIDKGDMQSLLLDMVTAVGNNPLDFTNVGASIC